MLVDKRLLVRGDIPLRIPRRCINTSCKLQNHKLSLMSKATKDQGQMVMRLKIALEPLSNLFSRSITYLAPAASKIKASSVSHQHYQMPALQKCHTSYKSRSGKSWSFAPGIRSSNVSSLPADSTAGFSFRSTGNIDEIFDNHLRAIFTAASLWTITRAAKDTRTVGSSGSRLP